VVRKRDGRLVAFDGHKIADAIYKAALSVGGADRFLAEELSEVVTLFLEKKVDLTIPTIEQIQDMVEKVLIETGHASTAKSFILYREERRKVRFARNTREAVMPAATDLHPTVLDLQEESAVPWQESLLAASIEALPDVPAEVAAEVAATVSSRLGEFGEPCVAASTVAALADAELFTKGLLNAGSGLSGPPRERVRDLLIPRDGMCVEDAAATAGRRLLRTFALEEIHSSEVAAAHVEGRIHIHGLDAPAGLSGASMYPDILKSGARPVGPVSAAAALGRALSRTARSLGGRFAADDVNVALAPLVRGLDDGRVTEVVSLFLMALDGRVEVNVDSEIPTLLAICPAVGQDGCALETCYGDFGREARTVLLAILDLWEAGRVADVPLLTVHLGPRGMSDPRVVDRACAAGLKGSPITFVRMKDSRAATGCSVLRRYDPAGDEAGRALRSFAFGKVTVHLPTAARLAQSKSPTRFLSECARAMDLAMEALRERLRFLKTVSATPGAPLEALARGEDAILNLDRGIGIIGVAGLNEAVEACLGSELHEEDEALKLGERVAAFFRLQTQEERRESDPDFVVAESWEPEVLSRLGTVAVTAGARLRPSAPVDLITRIEREGRFHPVVRSSTICALFTAAEAVPPASAAALLRKTFENTAAEGLRLGREAG
jgi:ribonucleoside-triphosphate reductase (formate)